MKYLNITFLLVALILLSFKTDVQAQRSDIWLDGGRFMWRIDPSNWIKAWQPEYCQGIYPGDYRRDEGYLNNMHAVQRFFTTNRYDEDHPWLASVQGVTVFAAAGVEAGQQTKYMRYPYPVITVDGEDAGLYQESEFIVDPNLECEMKGVNRSRSYPGLTWYTTSYTYSHPDYQDIVIEHQQIVNDGVWYQTGTVEQREDHDPNPINAVWIRLQRRYLPGYHTESFGRASDGTYVSMADGTQCNWNFWGYGVTEGVTDTTQLLMWQYNPDDKEGSELEDEGEWNELDNSFYFPYYFGQGFLDADGPLFEHENVTSPLYWWGIETYPYNLLDSDKAVFKNFLEAKTFWEKLIGRDADYFVSSIEGDGYGIPHYVDPDGDTEKPFYAHGYYDAKMTYYFGPFTVDIGDTIDLWVTHVAGGIDPDQADELGEQWAEKRNTDLTAGWSAEDIAWKNNILRTAGETDMLENYQKARELYENNMLPPKMNPVPPAEITITSNEAYVQIDWSSVDNAVKYNIYRGTGYLERLLYDSLTTVDANVNTFQDTTARLNFSYYYYVTAVDEDGLESSHYTVRPRLSASAHSINGTTKQDIRILPNPFILGSDNNYPNRNQMTIAGLPGPCKITILTITGDIVDEWSSGGEGSTYWFGKTKYNQYVASGVYIYHVQSKSGNITKTGKFIVVR